MGKEIRQMGYDNCPETLKEKLYPKYGIHLLYV